MVTAKKKASAAPEAGNPATAPVATSTASAPAAKPAPKKIRAATKPVAKAPAKSAAGAPAAPTPASAAPADTVKVKKPKLVRDSFTIPKVEYQVLEELKLRAADLKQPTKKSELLRAGIKALAAMEGAAFLAALRAVPAIKTGRPGKS